MEPLSCYRSVRRAMLPRASGNGRSSSRVTGTASRFSSGRRIVGSVHGQSTLRGVVPLI